MVYKQRSTISLTDQVKSTQIDLNVWNNITILVHVREL